MSNKRPALSFNSCMVQLKYWALTCQLQNFRSFNSCMVQLKLRYRDELSGLISF